ncbi:hypothetical protein ATANTOWER_018384 [Ataeniobius toweri]|uniref:Uncharacterized protein n=1 Tax=Ataeniobius toweri TaxID=208326 RepID=A0ABU7A0U0_9TELE|nr:hypothetical protein [Ataeniobius toweri]
MGRHNCAEQNVQLQVQFSLLDVLMNPWRHCVADISITALSDARNINLQHTSEVFTEHLCLYKVKSHTGRLYLHLRRLLKQV